MKSQYGARASVETGIERQKPWSFKRRQKQWPGLETRLTLSFCLFLKRLFFFYCLGSYCYYLNDCCCRFWEEQRALVFKQRRFASGGEREQRLVPYSVKAKKLDADQGLRDNTYRFVQRNSTTRFRAHAFGWLSVLQGHAGARREMETSYDVTRGYFLRSWDNDVDSEMKILIKLSPNVFFFRYTNIWFRKSLKKRFYNKSFTAVTTKQTSVHWSSAPYHDNRTTISHSRTLRTNEK